MRGAARGRGVREWVVVALGFGALAIACTYPLSLHLASLSRTQSTDGQFSIWNVAWVAHALLTDPQQVLDANIFYPRTRTLVYSEANLVAGAFAVPAYWLTRDPYVAHNFVLVLSFVLGAMSMYYLVRYLAADRRAAIVSAIAFAFTPHLFSHLQHIQLLMTAGIPLALLAFHRLADSPTTARGVTLGAVMAAEAYACAYYSVFVMLMVPVAALVVAGTRRLWRSRAYWTAIAVAALVAVALTLPLAIQYLSLQRETGFVRELSEAREFSADARAYLASSSYAHRWILPLIGRWKEVLFPGFTAIVFGVAGAIAGWRSTSRRRETVLVYATLGVLAWWVSLGPAAGLYSVLYSWMPGFTFLRAASRFGLIVSFSLAVLAGLGVSALLTRVARTGLVFAAVTALAIGELIEPVTYRAVRPVSPAYRVLAHLPRGGLLELPVYSRRFAFMRARYMLASTAHWQPLVNGYSDYMPLDFAAIEGHLGTFPSAESFVLVERNQIRYAIFHLKEYKGAQLPVLVNRLGEFAPYLQRLYADDQMMLYEITGYPTLAKDTKETEDTKER
jgi:hypothetical protein